MANDPIHFIYASTSGNTQFVMEFLAKIWIAKGIEVQIHRAENTDISLIEQNKNFLMATSTWDHGIINPFFDKLLAQMKTANFAGKKSAFIGLGDRRYEPYFFCAGMTTLKQVWEKNQGEVTGIALTIGREPLDEVIQKMIETWANNTLPLFDSKNETSDKLGAYNE